MKGEGGKGAGKDWGEILRGAFQVKGSLGCLLASEKQKKKLGKKKKASPKECDAKWPQRSVGYREAKKKKKENIIVFCYQKQHG